MAPASPGDARLLFVLDNDFGELTMSMLFVHGQPLVDRATFLLPPRLFDLNGRSLPVRVIPYRGFEDLERAIDAEPAEIVFLQSGYLLPAHGLASTSELGRLIAGLHRRGCGVVTSDPFWALMSRPADEVHPGMRPLVEAHAVLRSAVHLYPAPFSADGLSCVSFYNAAFAESPGQSHGGDGIGDNGSGVRTWLFALTALDYGLQAELWSREGFASRLVSKMAETLEAGRQPVLVAPEDCLDLVRGRLGGAGRARLISYCGYSSFLSILLEAEYMFTWNAASSSSHCRVLRGLPVFSLDPGHIARPLGQWYRLTVQHYYQGWVPPLLNQDEPLQPARLEAYGREFQERSRKIRKALGRASAPGELIERLLRPESEGRAVGGSADRSRSP